MHRFFFNSSGRALRLAAASLVMVVLSCNSAHAQSASAKPLPLSGFSEIEADVSSACLLSSDAPDAARELLARMPQPTRRRHAASEPVVQEEVGEAEPPRKSMANFRPVFPKRSGDCKSIGWQGNNPDTLPLLTQVMPYDFSLVDGNALQASGADGVVSTLGLTTGGSGFMGGFWHRPVESTPKDPSAWNMALATNWILFSHQKQVYFFSRELRGFCGISLELPEQDSQNFWRETPNGDLLITSWTMKSRGAQPEMIGRRLNVDQLCPN